MNIVIRPVGPADADGFVAVWEAVAGDGKWIGSEAPLTEERRQQLRAMAQEPGEAPACFVAEADGRIVGWVHVDSSRHGQADLGMGIIDGYRRQGIGTRLVERAVDWAREQGAHKLTLQVWPHNIAARRLYEKLGFEVEGRLRRHWRRQSGELWDAIVMGLVLDETSAGSPYLEA
ncbi:MAG: GNAT family N-acetyltransferase [Acidimicrobiales bacterium]